MLGIDLFSGAGGMSLGASMAGVRTLYAVEANLWAARTYAQNHKNVSVVAKTIEAVTRRDFVGIPRREQLVVFGGPPCQGFSTSNQKTRNSHNPTNWLFKEYFRVVKELVPDWVIFENVTGIVQTEKGDFLNRVIDQIEKLGYQHSTWVLNAADFGVPQRRTRLFIVASRGSGPRSPVGDRSDYRNVNVNEAISDLPSLTNGASMSLMPYKTAAHSAYAKRMRGRLRACANHLVTRNQSNIVKRYSFIPPGGNWRDIPARLMKNYEDRERCHEWIYHRLRFDEPSVVIGNYRKNMLIHPRADRGLSVREAARLQSFPDWFEFLGSIGFQQQQVGNAVPPLLARAVFRAVLIASGEHTTDGEYD